MKLGNLFKGVGAFVKKNDTTILTAINIAATIVAVGTAVINTPKCVKILDEMNEDGATSVEKAKAIIPVAAPTVIATGISITTAIANHKINIDRITSLVSAYSVLRDIHDEYQEHVKAELGEEKELEIRKDIAKGHYEEGERSIVPTGHGNDIFFDQWSGRWFYSDINYIKKVVNDLNRQVMNEMYVSVNEFYSDLGLPRVKGCEGLVWTRDYGEIDMNYIALMDECDKPYTEISFMNEPTLSYERRTRW